MPADEMAVLLRCLRARDVSILTMLAQQHYLTTDQVACLYFPSTRSAQMRLHWLAERRRALMRWRQLEPREQGWRRLPSLHMLSERGAVVLARCQNTDPRPLVKRSWITSEYSLHLDHDLEVNAFFLGLAAASQPLPDQGLYHWVGQDSLRSSYQEENVDLAPDGWGRYVTPAGEVMFSLEWDQGTERPQRLVDKVRAYVSYFAQHPGGLNHVLFVGPGEVREESIRAAITRATPRLGGPVRFWTTHADLLRQHGPLDAIWLGMNGSERLALPQLGGRPRTGRLASDCIGKPGWWERRPGAGEGA